MARGDRVVVRSARGLELGEVLCPATPGHARLLGPEPAGELLRLAAAEDDADAERMRQRGQLLFESARRQLQEHGVPLELLDVELSLDGARAILHSLRWADCDDQPWIADLERRRDGLARDALGRLERRLARLVRRARAGRIETVLGRKHALEAEVEALSRGFLPQGAVDSLDAARYLSDDEEYWPFDGEDWEDEYIGGEGLR